MKYNQFQIKTTLVKFVCTIVVMLLTQSVVAQYSQSERKVLKTANNYFEAGQYDKALPLYMQLDSVLDDITLRYQIGLCYLRTDTYKSKATPYLEEVYAYAGNLIPNDVIRYLGDAYHFEYRFDDAIKEYNTFIAKTAKSDKADIIKLNYCKRMITICQTAIELSTQPYKVDVEPIVSLLASESDYNPLISADETIMLFMREKGVGKGIKTTKSIMISTRDNTDDMWGKPTEVTINLDNKLQGQNVKLAGLSPDGTLVFLNIGEGLNQDLYTATLRGTTISDVKKMNKNINTPYYEGAASISADGTKLYFVSDRPGGLGGHDIYMSKLNRKGEWDEAVNLGEQINTKYDEDAPFIHYDGQRLFFSSGGYNTMGGRDIYRTTKTRDGWSQPENLGFCNTPRDDINFVLGASGEYGYFSTSKNNPYNKQTIMSVGYHDPIPLTLVKGVVKAGNPAKPVKIDIKVYDKNTQEQIPYVYAPDPNTGKYLMIFPPAKNYQLVISTPSYLPQLINIHVPYQNYFYELYQEITLTPIKLNNNSIGEEITVNNIFYDIYNTAEADSILQDDDVHSPMYYAHLLSLVENIIQTTDTLNKISYNTKRDNRENEEKIKQGTDFLLNMIEEAINTSDSVTLSILDANTKQKSKVTKTHFYTEGDREKSVNMQIIGVDTFYTAEPIDLSRYELPIQNRKEDNTQSHINPVSFKMSTPDERKIIHRHTLYYKVNDAELSKEAQKELNHIIDLLIDNNTIGAEINGYADSSGERNHNINLSQRRAQNVLKYMLDHNVDGRKIITKGLGESDERGQYDASLHEMNYRRVEIDLFELKK